MAKRKYTYEFIKEFIESNNYVFLITKEEYTNVGQTLKLCCPNKHIYTTNWGHFYHKGFRCKRCNKLNIDYIRKSFEDEDYSLLSTYYKNQLTKLNYVCSAGHRNTTTWNNWRQGCRCPDCLRTSYREVVEGFEIYGYKVLSSESEYINSRYKFVYKCPNKHKSSMTWSNFRYGFRCPVCSKGSVSPISQKWLDSLGIETREYHIKDLGFRVDGFDPDTNTVYEFFGDYWHGNPKIYSAKEINSSNKKTFGQLYQETMERIDFLKEKGYKVVYIWESDFSDLLDGQD